MLGEQTPAGFWNELFAGPWSAPEIEAHEGYARDHFKLLLARDTPPPAIPGNVWRALEITVWWFYRAHVLMLKQRERLAEENTNSTAAVKVDGSAKIDTPEFTNPGPLGTAP